MLADSQVATRLPAKDLERAKRFYSEKLGLQPVEERPGGLCYRCGTGYFVLFQYDDRQRPSRTWLRRCDRRACPRQRALGGR